jgi:hypothetical protein
MTSSLVAFRVAHDARKSHGVVVDVRACRAFPRRHDGHRPLCVDHDDDARWSFLLLFLVKSCCLFFLFSSFREKNSLSVFFSEVLLVDDDLTQYF